MDVPPASHPAWRALLTRQVAHDLDFLAAKILLGWLMLKVADDPSPEQLDECAGTLQHLFAQNAELPCVQHDLALVFRPETRARAEEDPR